eukprot:gnl/MRDRNA2_/MRDRNA2_76197_c0_seq1.p1 gnl/MRDRNA2_/MRDRNA2_76197_c0~~gnl/MRDRNA2_/MRDRNA2_76197_c0_seq1.p1  ORF type:complete len:901 (-),score=273.55 gnl/MRDRNA2_/MRDRNA2_76197_c0_seq1:193-2895(-)
MSNVKSNVLEVSSLPNVQDFQRRQERAALLATQKQTFGDVGRIHYQKYLQRQKDKDKEKDQGKEKEQEKDKEKKEKENAAVSKRHQESAEVENVQQCSGLDYYQSVAKAAKEKEEEERKKAEMKAREEARRREWEERRKVVAQMELQEKKEEKKKEKEKKREKKKEKKKLKKKEKEVKKAQKELKKAKEKMKKVKKAKKKKHSSSSSDSSSDSSSSSSAQKADLAPVVSSHSRNFGGISAEPKRAQRPPPTQAPLLPRVHYMDLDKPKPSTKGIPDGECEWSDDWSDEWSDYGGREGAAKPVLKRARLSAFVSGTSIADQKTTDLRMRRRPHLGTSMSSGAGCKAAGSASLVDLDDSGTERERRRGSYFGALHAAGYQDPLQHRPMIQADTWQHRRSIRQLDPWQKTSQSRHGYGYGYGSAAASQTGPVRNTKGALSMSAQKAKGIPRRKDPNEHTVDLEDFGSDEVPAVRSRTASNTKASDHSTASDLIMVETQELNSSLSEDEEVIDEEQSDEDIEILVEGKGPLNKASIDKDIEFVSECEGQVEKDVELLMEDVKLKEQARKRQSITVPEKLIPLASRTDDAAVIVDLDFENQDLTVLQKNTDAAVVQADTAAAVSVDIDSENQKDVTLPSIADVAVSADVKSTHPKGVTLAPSTETVLILDGDGSDQGRGSLPSNADAAAPVDANTEDLKKAPLMPSSNQNEVSHPSNTVETLDDDAEKSPELQVPAAVDSTVNVDVVDTISANRGEVSLSSSTVGEVILNNGTNDEKNVASPSPVDTASTLDADSGTSKEGQLSSASSAAMTLDPDAKDLNKISIPADANAVVPVDVGNRNLKEALDVDNEDAKEEAPKSPILSNAVAAATSIDVNSKDLKESQLPSNADAAVVADADNKNWKED